MDRGMIRNIGGGGRGELDAVRFLEYTGDGTNDRVILLGEIYHQVRIYSMDFLSAGEHLIEAICIQRPGGTEVRTISRWVGGGAMEHATGGAGDVWFQGFEDGQDRVKLGSSGLPASSTNRTAYTYMIVAKRFGVILP